MQNDRRWQRRSLRFDTFWNRSLVSNRYAIFRARNVSLALLPRSTEICQPE